LQVNERPKDNIGNPSTEQLVAVRAEVLNEVEHGLGNLFQRLYHLTRTARDGLGPYADRLVGTVQELERLVELVLDYVTPTELALRPTPVRVIGESLIANFQTHAPNLRAEGVAGGWVLADARVLGHSFHLLSDVVARTDLPLGGGLMTRLGPERVEWELRLEGALPPGRGAEGSLAWAVAARLIELHGGELSERMAAGATGASYVVALPRAAQVGEA
jgi:hypothetical protein